MSDIVKRLRATEPSYAVTAEAADRIEQLEAEQLATFARMRELNEYGSTQLETMAGRIVRLEGYIRYALDGPAHVATIRKILTDALQDDKP